MRGQKREETTEGGERPLGGEKKTMVWYTFKKGKKNKGNGLSGNLRNLVQGCRRKNESRNAGNVSGGVVKRRVEDREKSQGLNLGCGYPTC